jgi:hypothetical protein
MKTIEARVMVSGALTASPQEHEDIFGSAGMHREKLMG